MISARSAAAAETGEKGGVDVGFLSCGQRVEVSIDQDDGLPGATAGGEGIPVVAGEVAGVPHTVPQATPAVVSIWRSSSSGSSCPVSSAEYIRLANVLPR